MSKIISAGFTDDKVLSFTYTITDYCNYKCNYCCVPHSNKSPDENINKDKIWKFVFKILKKLDIDFEITLLGGEPTLHEDFFEIVQSLINMDKCTKIEIITNFAKPNKFFEKLNDFKSNKISMVISYHPEYDNNMFIEKLNSFEPTFNVDVSVSLYEGYLDECKNILDNSKFKSYPIYLTDTLNFKNTITVPKDFEHYFHKEDEKIPYTYDNGITKHFYSLDIYKNNLNRFKGYQCRRLIYDITSKGIFKDGCDQSNIGLLPKKEDLLKYKPCKIDYCRCDAYLFYHKKI